MTKYEQSLINLSFPRRRESIATMDPRLRGDDAIRNGTTLWT